MAGVQCDGTIYLDLSTSCRWSGNAVGVVRVEWELARWAHRNLPNARFVFFDPRDQIYRMIDSDWIESLLQGDCTLDHHDLSDPNQTRRRFEDRVPRSLQPATTWFLQFRRQLLLSLEDLRLRSKRPWLERLIIALEKPLMSKRYVGYMVRPDGTRRPYLRLRRLLREPIHATDRDVIICVGFGWSHSNIETVRHQKQTSGFRFVVLCHDIIPLIHPQYFKSQDTATFKRYFEILFEFADLIAFTTRHVEQDARTYCADQGLKLGPTCITPLGANSVVKPGPQEIIAELGLATGAFVLFVGTVEPRKGHRFLMSVWRRLLAEGIPQLHGFKLVFVGRPGWLVDDLLAEIGQECARTGSIVMHANADDSTLARLYAAAAFCVFPSEYEGYGLPIVEAFQHGKAVISSNGGALAEVVGSLSPCLSPRDENAWCRLIGEWISNAQSRQPYEDAIRKHFRARTWSEAAEEFFAATCRATARHVLPG